MGRGQWAADLGNVLLTFGAWSRVADSAVNENIRQRFLHMPGKPASAAKGLFIPTAAITDGAKQTAGKCR